MCRISTYVPVQVLGIIIVLHASMGRYQPFNGAICWLKIGLGPFTLRFEGPGP